MILLAGCNSLLGVHDFDATVDAMPDAQTSFCYGTTDATRVCLSTPPDVPRIFNGLIDTGMTNPDCLSAISGPAGCVLAYTDITVDNLRAVGRRPLILIASETFEVIPNGVLDVSSHQGAPGAAGRETGDPDGDGVPNDAGCDTPAVMGHHGGAGGSLGGRGGDGGGSTQAVTPVPPTQPTGGCPGGSSGATTGGPGGGAVLVIGTTVTISGTINASGAGGVSAPSSFDGGAGGGAGGSIFIDAHQIAGDGIVLANGGGGGGAGGAPTTNGGDPNPTTPLVRAPGGASGDPQYAAGGQGGAGAVHDGGAGSIGGFQQYGSGGGGGAGVVVVASPAPFRGIVSPN